ncbi:MAG: hypothetical protein ACI35W_05465, partial [Anaeroplasmataceae bacterium]
MIKIKKIKSLLFIFICLMCSIFVLSFGKNIYGATTISSSSYSNCRQTISLTKGNKYTFNGSYTFKNESKSSVSGTISKTLTLTTGYNTLAVYSYTDNYTYYFYLLYKTSTTYQIYFEFEDYNDSTDESTYTDYTSYSSSYGLQSFSLTYSLVDSTPPTISGATNGSKYTSDRTITYSDNVGVSTAYYKVNSGSSVNFSSGTTISAEGTIYVYVADSNGNSASITYYVDKTKPTISGATNGSKYTSNRTITYSDSNGVSTAYYTINGGSQVSFSSGTTINGEGTIYVYVVDSYGNSNSITYYVDKTKPTISGATNG